MQRQPATTLLALLVGCAVIPSTHAYSVTVVASQPVTTQIMPELAAIQGVMAEMVRMQTATGTAINQSSEKLASVIAQDGQATRQQMIFSNETRRLEEARKSFSVPDSICSESASGVAAESRRAAASAALCPQRTVSGAGEPPSHLGVFGGGSPQPFGGSPSGAECPSPCAHDVASHPGRILFPRRRWAVVAGSGALPRTVCFAKGTGFPTGMPGVFYRTESVPPPHHLGQEGVFPRGQATEKSAPPQGHPGPLPPGQFDALPADTPRGPLHRACGQMTLRQVARGFPSNS